jgi:hypothetical protein
MKRWRERLEEFSIETTRMLFSSRACMGYFRVKIDVYTEISIKIAEYTPPPPVCVAAIAFSFQIRIPLDRSSIHGRDWRVKQNAVRVPGRTPHNFVMQSVPRLLVAPP